MLLGCFCFGIFESLGVVLALSVIFAMLIVNALMWFFGLDLRVRVKKCGCKCDKHMHHDEEEVSSWFLKKKNQVFQFFGAYELSLQRVSKKNN